MKLSAKLKKCPGLGIVLMFFFSFVFVTSIWPMPGGVNPTILPSDDTMESPKDYKYNFPHPPESFSESLPFRHFNSDLTFQTEGSAGRALTLHEDTMLTPVKDAAYEYLKNLQPGNTFMNGRYRWLPNGVEYDLLYRDLPSRVTNRVTLFQKLESPKVIRSIEINDKTVVHVILTLRGRMDKYAIFLDHLVRNVLPEEPDLSLTVVHFSGTTLQEAKDLTTSKLSSVPNFKWSFVPLEDENFSRGRGLHEGAKMRRTFDQDEDEILFFCDVDVLMHPDFFSRCRSNAIQGHQVYYPVVFSLYNPQLVYPLFDKIVPDITDQLSISNESGFWRVFGFGMACMYRSDYISAGGFPDLQTWGGEDESLYQQLLKLDNIKVIRSPDPSLFHLYHKKECPDVKSTSYPACLKSKAMTEGSQLELGLTLLKLREGVDIEGILSQKFYYFWLVPYLVLLLVLSLLTNILQAMGTVVNNKRRMHIPRDMKL